MILTSAREQMGVADALSKRVGDEKARGRAEEFLGSGTVVECMIEHQLLLPAIAL